MPHIDSSEFGAIIVDGKKYHQVLIVGNLVLEREYEKLKNLFGTSHQIGDWEVESLLKESPEIIIIGTGQDGMLRVDKEFLDRARENNAELVVEITPKAVEIYNDKVKTGQRVNALIHTTC